MTPPRGMNHLAALLMAVSFVLLIVINLIEQWANRFNH